MQVFTCSTCQHAVYFENFMCTNCGAKLAFLPDLRVMSVLCPQQDDAIEPQQYNALAPRAKGALYRMCRNSDEHSACNWAVPADDAEELCRACRLNGQVAALGNPALHGHWLMLEAAKRRLMYSLLCLRLPLESRRERAEGGLEFRFLADHEGQKVFTGHSDGVITINVAEADDPFREKMKKELGEPYRTLLGHFRHEIGHYYWDRLVKNSPALARFRELFGDEQADYGAAVQKHYAEGPPATFAQSFVSAYATMHPWEDWAETWAHYLHIWDTLETARSYGISLQPRPKGGAQIPNVEITAIDEQDFDELISAWMPLTLALNSLNRSMGQPDTYPFVLAEPVLVKLRFVHDTIAAARMQDKRVAAPERLGKRKHKLRHGLGHGTELKA
jgi:hypothetical protein